MMRISAGANSNNGDAMSSQAQFGYADSAGASQNHKQQGPPQNYGPPNSAYNSNQMPPNQGRMNKEQNLKNFSKNIQVTISITCDYSFGNNSSLH